MATPSASVGATSAVTSSHPASIRQTFTLPKVDDSTGDGSSSSSTVQQTFDSTTAKPATLGLPPSTAPTKAEPGSFAYTGLHDHGPFVPPREGGDVALLIGCADEAQRASDKLLTGIIEEEKERVRAKKKRER